LEWNLEKYGGKMWTKFIWLRTGTIGGLFPTDSKSSGSIKGGEFLDQLTGDFHTALVHLLYQGHLCTIEEHVAGL